MKRLLRPEPLVVFLLLALATGVVLILPDNLIFGSAFGDLPAQFVPWRAFATASLRAGHLPLWNPYTYSGEPFLGEFQSALLYPPNVIFLCLPLAAAINLSILAHLVVLAWGMYRWALQRGLHPVAGIACGLTLALGGTVYPHIYAGHLPNLCTMAWAPWVLAGLEGWWTSRRRAGLFQASAAICLQILAGHPQVVFLTAIAAGVFALVCSVAEPSVRRRALLTVAGCYSAAALLAAAQLFPGFAAVGESARQAQPFAAASIFSFPPVNFLTLFAPGFFGDHLHTPYWGRWYLQEMSVFVGAVGIVLAVAGALAPGHGRRARLDLIACVLLLLLALGANTPLYHPLFEYVPGFRVIRGMSKFTFPAMIFLVLAVGAGADALVRRQPVRRGVVWFAFAGALLLAVAGLILLGRPDWIDGYIRGWLAVNEGDAQLGRLLEGGFAHDAGVRAVQSLWIAAALFGLTGGSLWWMARRPALRWVPLILLGVEMAAFASTNSAACDTQVAIPAGVRDFLAQHPGDYRVLTHLAPSGFDAGFLWKTPDLWGADPFLPGRYAEFINFTQGGNPDETGQFIAFKYMPPLYAMLRCRYTFAVTPDGHAAAYPAPAEPMDRAQLISDYRVLGGRNAIFAAMARPDFDPRRTVLLESAPSPQPVPAADPGTVHAVETSPDTLVIEADVKSPTLLLVTDSYSRDWRAVPLPGSSQQAYQVLPANYILRAVPLAAGHHRLLMEYAPPSFRLGIAVSLAAWLGWLTAAGASFRRRRAARA
jgi:hypothetical protein